MGFCHLLCFLSPATFILLITTTPSFCSAKINYFESCGDKEATYSQGSTYWANLKSLLSSFSSNITLTGEFRNTTIGHNPNTVYGLFQCRGDVTPQSCQACVKEASQFIFQSCPNKKNAIVWLDQCMLRIANRSFSSIMQTTPVVFLNNARNSSSSFDKISKQLMEGLATQAAFGFSNKTFMFATGESNFGRAQEIYGLVQCTGDVSQSDCDACLRFEIDYLVSCCEGRVATPSCYMRYETYRFYDSKPAVAVSTPPNTTTDLPPLKGKTGKGSNSHTAIIVNASVIPLVILLGFLLCYLWRKIRIKREMENRRRRAISLFDSGRESSDELKGDSKAHQMKSHDLPVIHLDVIIAATDNFSDANKLGQGGFGLVYKGTFHDGKEIAVKRLESSSRQGVEEFKNEVILISKLQHKNLVRLLGCCIQGDEKLLIYEYMPNTSLDSFLFDPRKCDQLDWGRRHNIINGIARGLLYLHEDSRLKIIHRDLKAGNVLLDHELNAKISDFGMARIVERNQDNANTNRVVGTYGYMAPEYAMEGLFSVKSDVFSFGVLLLEIISGKRNTGFHLSGYDQSLLTYAWRLWCENKELEIMDPLLKADDQSSNVNSEEVLQCIHIGLLCVQEDPVDRPTMSSVVLMLASANNSPISFPQPTQPAFSVGRGAVAASSLNEVSFSSASPS